MMRVLVCIGISTMALAGFHVTIFRDEEGPPLNRLHLHATYNPQFKEYVKQLPSHGYDAKRRHWLFPEDMLDTVIRHLEMAGIRISFQGGEDPRRVGTNSAF